ncbi:hypothetical protein H2203_004022 [Taxawa tesnikishii (nom. ined.)]|nr:hypothetical protein H2203_004022 [Dothideales sp. JES 119]
MLFGSKSAERLSKGSQMENGEVAKEDASGSSEVNGLPAGAMSQETGKYETDEPKRPHKGLTAGERKPSVHMLQTAIQGGRVLSAEEISFSMKVRSMYEHGDEDAAQWDLPAEDTVPRAVTPDRFERETNTPDVDQKRQSGASGIIRSSSRFSFLAREPYEIAGGIEDWEDVEGGDVDRYGFIDPKRITSRASEGAAPATSQGIQRVSTSLQVLSSTPRRKRSLRRGMSRARSSRSQPPSSPRTAHNPPTSPGSVYSYRSTGSSTFHSPFRSRDRRLLDEASDMLTLPPGLADVAEQEDAGRSANLLKRREWAREEKWQKMARRTDSGDSSQGGGMTFGFDTNDPKLISRTWKGIPDRWRATAWHAFLSASARRRRDPESDERLVAAFHAYQSQSCADDVQIDVDVPRTINMHIMFRRRYRGGQRLLFRVLHAIALHFPAAGYVQGMAALAATLLCYYDEERAFLMLVRLWRLRGLETLYASGFAGLMAALNEFEECWLKGSDVQQKLDELGIGMTAYGTRWYLTLFNMSVPFPAQLRVWDVFMLLGDAEPAQAVEGDAGDGIRGADLDVLHATSAALVDATRNIILDGDFENVMKTLTSWMPVRDEDLLMRIAKAEYKMKKKRDGR